jgi:hypothetical protein
MNAAAAKHMRLHISNLTESIAAFLRHSGQAPISGSTAEQEIAQSPGAVHLQAALDQGWLLTEGAADHLMALLRVLEEPCMTIAPWGCARGVLEASAYGCWIQDFNISSQERLSRSLAVRYKSQKEQMDFACVAKRPESEIQEVEARLLHLEKAAVTFGVAIQTKTSGKTRSIGAPVPYATDCVKETLGEDKWYKLCCAMVHGQTWAYTQLGFIRQSSGSETRMEKGLDAHAAALMLLIASRALSKVVWTRARLCGYDTNMLERLLTESFDEVGLSPNQRFWLR